MTPGCPHDGPKIAPDDPRKAPVQGWSQDDARKALDDFVLAPGWPQGGPRIAPVPGWLRLAPGGSRGGRRKPLLISVPITFWNSQRDNLEPPHPVADIIRSHNV